MNLFDRLREKKVMLIDDDRWIRNSLRLYFEGEGINLLALETAEEGLKELKKCPHDILIVDYRLPGIDGLEFFKLVQSSHPQAIKIIITAYKDQNIVSQASKIGINDFVEKPFSIHALEKVLTWELERQASKKKSDSHNSNKLV